MNKSEQIKVKLVKIDFMNYQEIRQFQDENLTKVSEEQQLNLFFASLEMKAKNIN